MKLPSWFQKKPPEGPTGKPSMGAVEIAQANLTEAKADLAAAERRVADSLENLKSGARTQAAVDGHRDAKLELEQLSEFVAIVQADHDRAVAEHKAAQRAKRERQREVVQNQLADRTEAAKLERIEAEAYVSAIEARVERIRHLEQCVELQRTLYNIQTELGEQTGAFESDSTVPSVVPIAEALHARAAALPAEDPRRELLQQLGFKLAPGLASYRGVA